MNLHRLISNLSKSIPKHIKATKRSSVSIILRPTTSSSSTTATSFDILYLRRADYPGDPWSGQVCFSGGKRESIDQSDLETAVRETKEEINIDLSIQSDYTYLGQLHDRPAYSRGKQIDLSISAFIFLQKQNHTQKEILLEKGGEISAARWIPFELLTESNINWNNIQWEYVSNLFPILGTLPTSLLRLLGLSTLRFPSLPLHTFDTDTFDPPTKTELITVPDSNYQKSKLLPFNLWGLTFRLTEDLLLHLKEETKAEQKEEEQKEEEQQQQQQQQNTDILGSIPRPQLLFQNKRLGSLANIYLKRYNTKY